MIKYILSIDYGSSLFKYLIMKIDGSKISIFQKGYFENNTFEKNSEMLKDFFDEKNIDISTQLEVVATGAKISKVDNFYNNNIFHVSEFTALSYGVLLPNDIKEALIASVGTGTSYIYSNINDTFRVSGSGMGGGPILAISKYVLNEDSLTKSCECLSDIDIKKVDSYINELVLGNSYESLNKDLTASNMTKIDNSSSKEEFVLGLYNMICQNIGIEAINSANIVEAKNNMDNQTLPIIFTGTLTTFPLIRKLLDKIANDLGYTFSYADNGMHTSAIGAYEYYLINEREKHI